MNYIEEKKYWIWLSLIKGLGSIGKQRLLQSYKTPKEIYNLPKEELRKMKGIGENIINSITSKQNKEKLKRHMEYMMKEEIDIITIQDKEYPKALKEIYDYPPIIYIKGDKEALNIQTNIAIIGCREYSKYGKECAIYFSYHLSKEKVTIISGLAKGIDSFSHKGAIQAQGRTVAVLGNGLDRIYPSENKYLVKEIIEKSGAIISEYPLGTEPERMNFPARNRIISGISKGIIVIEAKKKSGTMLTVDFALEQGKDIYAVPGNINSLNSTGTNELIKQGAKLITNYREIEL